MARAPRHRRCGNCPRQLDRGRRDELTPDSGDTYTLTLGPAIVRRSARGRIVPLPRLGRSVSMSDSQPLDARDPTPHPVGNAVGANNDLATVISNRHPKPVTSPGDVRGRRLGQFELLEPVGVGGMAAVIKARDMLLDRVVALKVLPPEDADSPDQVTRFRQEARAAALLDHEAIARVFCCGEDHGLHYIAFEFVEGENLRDVLVRRGTPSVADAVHYMLQAAAGLAHAASRGVVHRDIKPSNIIITSAGRAKIVDMGLARHRDAVAPALTQSGVTLGTFDYISPEQAIEPRLADTRSDIYSLGCTFYHALTGRPPVPDGTAAKKLQHHQQGRPIDPRDLNPAVPDSLAAVLARMMAKDPRERYQRPEQVVRHLIPIAESLNPTGGPGLPAGGGDLFMDAPLAAPPNRQTPALVVFVAVLAVAVLVTILELVQSAGSARTSFNSWRDSPASSDGVPHDPAPPPGSPP